MIFEGLVPLIQRRNYKYTMNAWRVYGRFVNNY